MPFRFTDIHSPAASARSRARTSRAIVVGGCVMVLAAAVYWLALFSSHRYMQRYTQDQAWLRVTQMSHAMAVHASTMLSGLDYSLKDMVRDYEAGDPQMFARTVASLEASYPPGTIVQIAVADAKGQVVYSSLDHGDMSKHSVSIYDREHFQSHLQGQTQGLFIGRPVQGRVSGQWSIQLSRAMFRQGKFSGVVVLSLSPEYLSRQLQTIFDSPRDVIVILREDGSYLARSQQQNLILGRKVPQERIALFAPNVRQGTYELRAQPDEIQRMYAWTRVPGFPLLVSTGLDSEAVYGPLRATIRQSLWRNSVGTLLIFLGGLLAAWLAFLRWREEAQRVEAEQRFMHLSQEVPGGLFQYGVDASGQHTLSFSNPGFYAMHCMAAQEATATLSCFSKHIHPDDLPGLRASIAEVVQSQSDWACKYRVVCTDGALHWLQGHARSQRMPDSSTLWHGYILDVTQDELLRNALRRSEERLRLTIDAVRDGLWQWDCINDRVLWDARCYAMLDMEDQSLGSFTLVDFEQCLHPADLPHVQAQLKRHLECGEPFRVEMRLRQANGAWRWVESRGEVMQRSATGQALRMMGTHTDIHDRVEQTYMVNALLERGSAMVLVADHVRNIVYANARAAAFFGIPAGSISEPCSFRELHLSTESFERFASLYDSLRLHGAVRTEWELCAADKRTCWFDIQGTLLNPNDIHSNVIWTLIDVDARRHAENALQQAQQRMEAVIERFPSGILVTDSEGRNIVAGNAMLVSLFDLPLSIPQIIGKSIQTLLPLLPSPVVQTLQIAQEEDTKAESAPFLHALPNGRHIEIEQLPLRKNAYLLGHCWVFHDVSDYKLRESQLEALASTDTLTGASNRRAFTRRAELELERLRQGMSQPAALIMLDIDHFKRVNDNYGHAIGDEVLKHLVITVSKQLRKGDMLGRLGGEEFAVLLTNVEAHTALRRAEDLRETVERLSVPVQGQEPIRFTVSLGVCHIAQHDVSFANYLERADAAMYYSKRNGRNRSTLWTVETPVIIDTPNR